MRIVWPATWGRLVATVAIAGVALAAAFNASAQSAPTQFTSNAYTGGGAFNACADCHGNPPLPQGAAPDQLPFNDPSIFSMLSTFKTALGVPNVDEMNFFRTNAGVSDTDRQTVLTYLINVRDTVVTSSVPAFPTTSVGSTSLFTRAIVITNFRGEALNFTAALTNSSDFGFTSDCGASVAAQSNCTLTVSFHPVNGLATSRGGNLNVTFTSGTTVVPPARSIGLLGTVPPAQFGFVAGATTVSARVDLAQFADVTIGTITNTGDATLTVSSIALTPPLPSGATYALAPPVVGACAPPQNLNKNASCNVRVRFTPSVPGASVATFRISHNAAGSPFDVVLTGTGTRPLVSPTALSVSFGNVQIGVPKLFATPVVVSNVGSAPLTFSVAAPPNSAAALSGPNKTDFSVTGNCLAASPLAAVVPPATVGGTCNLNITFTPGAISPPLRTATLTINSDATNGPLLIALDGNGVALPEPIVTFPGSNFPDTVIGETAALTRQVTIHNDRTRDITYSVANITDFTIGTESCPGRVVTGGGGDCTVNIQFAPTLGSGEGPRVGTLTFTFAGTGGDIAPSNATGNVGGNALLPLGPPTSTLNAAAVVGTPTTVSELLTNRAATPLTLTSLVLGGTNPGDYAFDATNTCTNGRVLAASSSCMLVVRFAPVTAGARNATISITHTAPGSPQTVTLLGTATPAPQGRIVVGATSPLVFPDTQLGSTFPQSFIVQNTGNLALTFSAFTISGAAAADYLRGGDCSVAAPLPIGGQCTLTLTFQPTALGLRSASIVITSDASNGAASLVLNGTGIPVPVPVVSLTPPALDFGVQTTGGIYPSRRLHLANVGTANLIIASVAVEGTGFANASATPCPAVLAPGAACDIDVAFMATAAIPYSGDVRVTSNAAGSPNLSTLSGSGSAAAVAVLIWSPAVTTIDFGTVVAGSVSAVQSVTVLNQGPGGVNLTVLNAVGFDSASFSVVGGTCQIGVPLFQGDSCRVDVQFSPGSSGPKTAQVQIASTGSFPTTLTLTGIGLAGPNPNLAVSATSMAFGTTTVGAQSVPATIRLTSSGSGVVRVSAVGVTGAYVVQSTTCPAVPFSLPAGSECTISVSFRPTAEGVANGVLSITTDAVPSERDVALTGTGQAEADVSSGGCSISSGRSLLDPTLWLLALLAVVALAYRRRQRQHARERK